MSSHQLLCCGESKPQSVKWHPLPADTRYNPLSTIMGVCDWVLWCVVRMDSVSDYANDHEWSNFKSQLGFVSS